MELSLPRTCYGPGDMVACTATLTGNPDWVAKVKKVRAEKLVLTIEQVVTYRLSPNGGGGAESTQTRTKKVAENRIDFGGLKLIEKPLTQRIAAPFPAPDLQRDKAGLVSTSDTLAPGSVSFSTVCKLYSVEFRVSVRATFKGAKDITATAPIVGSRYTLAEARVILENIEGAVYDSVDVDVVSGVCGKMQIVRKADIGPGMQDARRTVVME